MRKVTFVFVLLHAVWPFGVAQTQGIGRLTDSVCYRAELQATVSGGNHSPLWLNANRYGLSSVNPDYGYLRAVVERPIQADSARQWGIGYAADVALGSGMTNSFVVQQAYVEARWLHGVLTVGSKEQPMALKNPLLSSGSQTFGINARPIPQLRVALPDYWSVSGTRHWLALKGHLAYGLTTDDGWQKDFTHRQTRYTEHVLYHSKAGYLRLGPRNITMEMGLEMGSMFGGKSYNHRHPGSFAQNKSGLRAFFDALLMGGTDSGEGGVSGVYENVGGSHVGSWVARLNFDYPSWNLGVYADHFFEDQSSMFFLDFDGYGSGTEWDTRKENRYFRYDLKDIMLGAELQLKNGQWIDDVVVEYLYTKYQSGPVYHDHTPNISTHISGQDDYYNHYFYTGWQHWGQVMGNPLYRSPLYNDDAAIRVQNNRFVAWHVGLSGRLLTRMRYRLLTTVQRGYGTYYRLYPDPRDNVSVLAEACYRLPRGGWGARLAVGFDSGQIYGSQLGLQLAVSKSGLIKRKIKR